MRSNSVGTSVAGFVQIGLGAIGVALSVWASTPAPWFYTLSALLAGTGAGVAGGRRTGRKIERQAVADGRIVLYSEDTPLYALLLPLASFSLSPVVFVSMVYSVWTTPVLQMVLPVALCAVTSAWLAHDATLGRHLSRLAAAAGPLPIQWFHARSVVGPEGMIGQRALVTGSRHVRLGGERWEARSFDGSALHPGEHVIIHQVDGLVLVVESSGASDADGAGGR